MRRIIAGAFVSMDGVMQSPGGAREDRSGGFDRGGWLVRHLDEIIAQEIETLFARPFDLLLGRRTYEQYAAHWPRIDTPIARLFNGATKYVASTTLHDPSWEKTVLLRDAAGEVAQLKRREGPTLITQGSSDLIQTLLACDLIDEIRLMTVPVLLGNGKKLFGEGVRPSAFRLVDSVPTATGAIISRYERSGVPRPGIFNGAMLRLVGGQAVRPVGRRTDTGTATRQI